MKTLLSACLLYDEEMTEGQNDNENIDIDNLKNWEKANILQVLNRNQKVRKLDERRITQLCVRLQLNRMSDNKYADMQRIVLTQSGSWIKKISDRPTEPDPLRPLQKTLTNAIKGLDPEKLKPPKSCVKEPRCYTLEPNPRTDRLRGLSGTDDDENKVNETPKQTVSLDSEINDESDVSPSPTNDKGNIDSNDDGFVSCGSET